MSLTYEKAAEVGAELVQLGTDIAKGDVVDTVAVAKRLFSLATSIISPEDLKSFLSEQDRTFVDLSVDVAEQVKLDGSAER